MGTPEFMAPEQVWGRKEVTDRTDVYALGLVVYECMTGSLPYHADTPHEWLLAHTLIQPRDAAELLPGLDATLADVLMSCLRKAPHERPSAADVARSLREVADRLGVPALDAVRWDEVAPAAASGRGG